VRLVPRPGKINAVDFAVIMTAEIDGTVYLFNRQQRARGLGDIELELVDGNGKVVRRTKSASDGYYVVPSVPPGDYSLRVPRGQLKARGLIAIPRCSRAWSRRRSRPTDGSEGARFAAPRSAHIKDKSARGHPHSRICHGDRCVGLAGPMEAMPAHRHSRR
jgi:hypothetical protein